jgi:Tol biopolymer transport system component
MASAALRTAQVVGDGVNHRRAEFLPAMKADDMSKVETLTEASSVQIPFSFNADGTRLAYAESSEASRSLDLWTVPVGHSAGTLTAGEPEPFLRTPSFVGASSFSPDGRWLLYASGSVSHGDFDVYVQAFPPDGSKAIEVSQGGGRAARWLSNGREIVYRTDDRRLMVVGYQVKNGTFVAGMARETRGAVFLFDQDALTWTQSSG